MKVDPIWIRCGLVMLLAAPSFASALASVESRRGEPVVRSSVDAGVSMAEDRAARLTLKQVEALKQEMSELRGLVETQQHEIERLKKSQQDFYVDLDKRLSQKPLPKKSVVAANTAEPKNEEITPNNSKSAVVPVTEKEAYEAAYHFMQTKQYSKAAIAFQDYVTRFSKGENVPNAYYWLGEVYMVQWQADKPNQDLLDKATQAFLSVTSQFPTHPKVANALLKLGLAENEKGDWEAARHYLTEVKARYPETAAARIAETHLQQLN